MKMFHTYAPDTFYLLFKMHFIVFKDQKLSHSEY